MISNSLQKFLPFYILSQKIWEYKKRNFAKKVIHMLTDEEKAKIKAEEEFRAKARKEAENKKSLRGCLTGLVLLFLIVGYCSTYERTPMTPEQIADRERCPWENQVSVRRLAEKVVTQSLKSPGSAKFVTVNEFRDASKDCAFNVKGQVDSENAFGALLRSTFHVYVEFSKGKEANVELKFLN